MITTDNYLDYDYDRHEYYLTTNGLIEYMLYDEADLAGVLGENLEKICKFATRRIYREIYQTNYNRQMLQYKVYLNQENERQSILEASVEYLKGAYESGMDINAYTNGESDLPRSVHNLIGQNLLYQGKVDTTYLNYLDEVYGADY
jgi:hypothetical protein